MEAGELIALGLFVAVGLALGLMGGGGSIVTLPVLVYVAGVEPRKGVAMSLVIVGAASFAGAYAHYRRGHHQMKAVFWMGLTGVAGAYLGSQLTEMVSPRSLMLIFAALMLVVGIAMLREKPVRSGADRCSPLRCGIIGVCVGALTGFLGIGGGFLLVPALTVLVQVEPHKAVGASLAIIALNSISGLLGHLRSATIDWSITLAYLVMSLLGMWIGTRLSERISADRLRGAFAWTVVGMALLIAAMHLWKPGVAGKMTGSAAQPREHRLVGPTPSSARDPLVAWGKL